jgi:hypothetical protein
MPVAKSTGEAIVPSAVALPLGEQKYVFCASAVIVHNSTPIVNITFFITNWYYYRNKDHYILEINVDRSLFFCGKYTKNKSNFQEKMHFFYKIALFFFFLSDFSQHLDAFSFVLLQHLKLREKKEIIFNDTFSKK